MTGPEDLQSNRVRIALEMPRQAFRCPVLGCDWTATTADIMAAENTVTKASGPSIDEAINAMARGQAAAIEAFLRRHLETHDVIDYLRTIRDLEQQVYNAGHTGVRPHRRVNESAAYRASMLAEMTGEQRGRAAETLQRYNEIDGER